MRMTHGTLAQSEDHSVVIDNLFSLKDPLCGDIMSPHYALLCAIILNGSASISQTL